MQKFQKCVACFNTNKNRPLFQSEIIQEAIFLKILQKFTIGYFARYAIAVSEIRPTAESPVRK